MQRNTRYLSAMTDQFNQAKDKVTTLTKDPGNEVKLKMYALFKQVKSKERYCGEESEEYKEGDMPGKKCRNQCEILTILKRMPEILQCIMVTSTDVLYILALYRGKLLIETSCQAE